MTPRLPRFPMPRCLRILIATAVVLTELGCSDAHASKRQDRSTADATVEIKAISPLRQSLARIVEQPGVVQAWEQTELHSKLSGYVAKVNADIGQKVRGPKLDAAGKVVEPGEVLAEISIPELLEEAKQKQAAVRQTEAEEIQARRALSAAEATVSAMEASVGEAKAAIGRADAQVDRWQLEAARVAKLVREGIVDVQLRDETESQLRAARAGREECLAKVASTIALVKKSNADREKAGADVQAALSRIEVAKADAGRIAAMLRYARIHAPYDAIVTRRGINTGDLVQPANGKGAGLFSVSRVDPVRLLIQIPEADASLIQKGSQARIMFPSLKGLTLTGKVARTAWALEPSSRALRAEVDVPNPDGKLRPGMYLNAFVTGQLPEAWVLPVSAVVKRGDALVCFKIDGDKVIRTPVQVGNSDGVHTEVIRYQGTGAMPTWVEFNGKERFAIPASGLSDGQTIKMP